MSEGSVSEDLFRRQLELTATLAANLTDQSRTLAQVVEIQRDIHVESSKMNAMLELMDRARGTAVETIQAGHEQIEQRIIDSEARIVTHSTHQADRLEFWKKPVTITLAIAAASSSVINAILQLIQALRAGH